MRLPRSIRTLTALAVLAVLAAGGTAPAQTCCEKARAAGSDCPHPCCTEMRAFELPCLKCDPSATAVLPVERDLEAWSFRKAESSRWAAGKAAVHPDHPERLRKVEDQDAGELINLVEEHGQGTDVFSRPTFGDCRLELDVLVPQGSNSGIYLMGEYEVQVLDSFGKTELSPGDMGAIYGAAAPKQNACKAPGEWQHFAIEFRAPRFDAAGKKTENARFLEVTLNGVTLHRDVEMKGPTPGGLTGAEKAAGPLMFQGDHGPVAYRDVRITGR